MGNDQEWVNRSHGQKLRRLEEREGVIIDVLASHQERLDQHERDIKMIKATSRDNERSNG